MKRRIFIFTIETKFYKSGNKVSMLETSNKFDEEKVTKEDNIWLSRDPNASFPSDIVETLVKHDI